MPDRMSDRQVQGLLKAIVVWMRRYSCPELWFLVAVLVVMILTAAGL